MSSVAANRERIMRDIETAKALLDRHAVLTGYAYQELTMLSFVMTNAVRLLLGPMKGQYDDITTARELAGALNRAEMAVTDMRAA